MLCKLYKTSAQNMSQDGKKLETYNKSLTVAMI